MFDPQMEGVPGAKRDCHQLCLQLHQVCE